MGDFQIIERSCELDDSYIFKLVQTGPYMYLLEFWAPDGSELYVDMRLTANEIRHLYSIFHDTVFWGVDRTFNTYVSSTTGQRYCMELRLSDGESPSDDDPDWRYLIVSSTRWNSTGNKELMKAYITLEALCDIEQLLGEFASEVIKCERVSTASSSPMQQSMIGSTAFYDSRTRTVMPIG